MFTEEDMESMRKESLILGYKQAYKDATMFLIITTGIVGIVWLFCKVTVGI
jgi:hypothetical protein